MTISPTDPFLGTWLLEPAQSQYAFGPPPKTGTYTLSAQGEYIHFDIAWTDQNDQPFQHSFDMIPDGQQHPYENPAVADFGSLTRVNERTLDSATFKGGQQIAYASRVLSDDGLTMTVSQSGNTPQGEPFVNVSRYTKQTGSG